jgi:hypothetical protein
MHIRCLIPGPEFCNHSALNSTCKVRVLWRDASVVRYMQWSHSGVTLQQRARVSQRSNINSTTRLLQRRIHTRELKIFFQFRETPPQSTERHSTNSASSIISYAIALRRTFNSTDVPTEDACGTYYSKTCLRWPPGQVDHLWNLETGCRPIGFTLTPTCTCWPPVYVDHSRMEPAVVNIDRFYCNRRTRSRGGRTFGVAVSATLYAASVYVAASSTKPPPSFARFHFL